MKNTKDWIGNESFFITNHRKKESEISQHELYSTHPDSVRSFLKEYKIDNYCWEPACGTGNICKVLKENNIEYFASDKFDYECETDHLIDFLNCNQIPDNRIRTVITNPPYKYADDFVYKFFELFKNKNATLIMFLKLTFLEGKKRYKLYEKYPPEKIFLHSSRQGCSPKGAFEFKNGGAVAYAWYVWKTGFSGDTIIKWIKPNS